MEFGGQTKGKNRFEEQDVDGILTIKYILKKQFWKAIDLSASDYGQKWQDFVKKAINFPTAQSV